MELDVNQVVAEVVKQVIMRLGESTFQTHNNRKDVLVVLFPGGEAQEKVLSRWKDVAHFCADRQDKEFFTNINLTLNFYNYWEKIDLTPFKKVIVPVFPLTRGASIRYLTSCRSFGENIIIEALLLGKKVVVNDVEFRREISSPLLKREIEGIRKELTGWGVEFSSMSDLEACQIKDSSLGEVFSVITASDVLEAVKKGKYELFLTPKGVVTPLAWEESKKYNVKIIRKD